MFLIKAIKTSILPSGKILTDEGYFQLTSKTSSCWRPQATWMQLSTQERRSGFKVWKTRAAAERALSQMVVGEWEVDFGYPEKGRPENIQKYSITCEVVEVGN